jgi:hypothetical protein
VRSEFTSPYRSAVAYLNLVRAPVFSNIAPVFSNALLILLSTLRKGITLDFWYFFVKANKLVALWHYS